MSSATQTSTNISGRSDDMLVRDARAGDRDAFAEIVERYRDVVLGVAYSRLGDFGRSEDVAQQTFITAWTRNLDLTEPSQLAAWLCGIARNLVRNARRRTTAEATVPLNEQVASRDRASPEGQAIAKEEAALLWSILETIPETYREPMVLYYRKDATTAEVAAALEISEEVVRQRLSRGRKLLEQRAAEFVERALARRTTSPKFVTSVLLALPAGPKGGVGVLSAIAAKLGISIGAILGPLIGLAGGIYGSKRSFDRATSRAERRVLWQLVGILSILITGFFGLQFALRFWGPAIWGQVWLQATIWGGYSILLVALIAWSNRRQRAVKLQHGTAEERNSLHQSASTPVPRSKAVWNLLGGIIGCVAWMFVVAIRQHDWLGLCLVGLLLAALCAYFPRKLAEVTDSSQQMRLNWQALAFTFLGTLLVVAIRWSAWKEALLSP